MSFRVPSLFAIACSLFNQDPSYPAQESFLHYSPEVTPLLSSSVLQGIVPRADETQEVTHERPGPGLRRRLDAGAHAEVVPPDFHARTPRRFPRFRTIRQEGRRTQFLPEEDESTEGLDGVDDWLRFDGFAALFDMAGEFWPRWPVILEHEHYGASKARGAWGDGSLLLKAVEDYHGSYLSIHWWPRELLEENRPFIERINRRLGYRILLREMSWPARVAIDRPFAVRSAWSNGGVAPCYPGGFAALTLKDGKGGIVSVLVDEGFDVRGLEPGPAAEGGPARAREVEWTVIW